MVCTKPNLLITWYKLLDAVYHVSSGIMKKMGVHKALELFVINRANIVRLLTVSGRVWTKQPFMYINEGITFFGT